jgi:ER lumen protein retaining receptor
MNIFRLTADLSHLVSILLLIHKIRTTRNVAGLSLKSQAVYMVVYLTRYIDLFWSYVSLYNTAMKLLFIGSQAYILYLMTVEFKPQHDMRLDTFKLPYLFGAAAVMSLIAVSQWTPSEIIWSFSIWLESGAILPQLLMLQRTGEAENLTVHYLFALGIYRGLYIPNWVWRYFTEGHFDPVAVVAGLIQTALYADFFYIYFTK